MKTKTLLTCTLAFILLSAEAQKRQQKTTAYAITGVQKGNSHWTEVRLVDVKTGEELETIYQSSQEIPVLNARTGKPIVKEEVVKDAQAQVAPHVRTKEIVLVQAEKAKLVEELQKVKRDVQVLQLDKIDGQNHIVEIRKSPGAPGATTIIRKAFSFNQKVRKDAPFATTSAACAYDRKHDRLYYTPMGINQLRYIDLKSNEPKIYYFEDEAFGVVNGSWDVRNQITRMVIAADGNGYALSNNADHLIRFTTKRKQEITDMGALADDPANGSNSVRGGNVYGGDMIASESGDLYLITANRMVFKIDIDKMIATYQGSIKGLPRGFSTNGAIVEGGTTIVVSSANSTMGYYKFDLNSLEAEKVSASENVFNASDLANANLISEKKKKKQKQEEQPVEVSDEETITQSERKSPKELLQPQGDGISVYPNPATLGSVLKVSFADHPAGRYSIQLMEISGKLVDSRQVSIGGKRQVEEFRLPALIGKGNYLIKVVNETGKVIGVTTIIVQ